MTAPVGGRTRILQAVEADTAAVVTMGLRFVTDLLPDQPLDPLRLARTARWLMADGLLLVAKHDDRVIGMIGLSLSESVITGCPTAAEHFWWVDPAYRGSSVSLRLLKAALGWAREHECRTLQMVSLASNPQAGVVYRRLGFRPLETIWEKVL